MIEKYDAPNLTPAWWLDENPGIIPTKAILLVESIDGEGHTTFHHLVSQGCHEWHEFGMLRAATEQVEMGWQDLHEDDDE